MINHIKRVLHPQWLSCGILSSLLVVSGCVQSEGTYSIHLSFESEQARQAISEVELWVLEPAETICDDLVMGQVSREDLTDFTSLVTPYPPLTELALPEVPERDLLFYAEGRLDQSVLLRGCTRARVEGGKDLEVNILLIQVCVMDPAGEIPANGRDDDCDGLTDETIDDQPPGRSDGSPSGSLPAGTSAVEISLVTSEAGLCRYGSQPGTVFDDIVDSMATEDGVYHHASVSGLEDGASYVFYVRCQDPVGNANPDDYLIQFSVGSISRVDIFRSVGPARTTPLISGSSNPMNIGGGAAEFEVDLPGHVGVGDLIQYDANEDGEPDSLAMITGRVDPKTFSVRALDGQAATATTVPNEDWSIYRAYTSLDAAVRGEPNSGIHPELRDFDSNFPPDLIALGATWNIACYADFVDSTNTLVSQEWNTGPDNYLRIFTPSRSSEAGTSQRHTGKWTEDAYIILNTAPDDVVVSVNSDHVRIEGLQFDVPMVGGNYSLGVSIYDVEGSAVTEVSNCIFRGYGTGTGEEYIGVEIWDTPGTSTLQVFNCLFYGFDGSAAGMAAIWNFTGTLKAYNNTIALGHAGIISDASTARAKNNLMAGCTHPALGVFVTGTDYNATDSASMEYTVQGGSNTNDRVGQVFSFENPGESDYHLAGADTGARDQGSSDVEMHFDTDIDGQTRTGTWDIGADEDLP